MYIIKAPWWCLRRRDGVDDAVRVSEQRRRDGAYDAVMVSMTPWGCLNKGAVMVPTTPWWCRWRREGVSTKAPWWCLRRRDGVDDAVRVSQQRRRDGAYDAVMVSMTPWGCLNKGAVMVPEDDVDGWCRGFPVGVRKCGGFISGHHLCGVVCFFYVLNSFKFLSTLKCMWRIGILTDCRMWFFWRYSLGCIILLFKFFRFSWEMNDINIDVWDTRIRHLIQEWQFRCPLFWNSWRTSKLRMPGPHRALNLSAFLHRIEEPKIVIFVVSSHFMVLGQGLPFYRGLWNSVDKCLPVYFHFIVLEAFVNRGQFCIS